MVMNRTVASPLFPWPCRILLAVLLTIVAASSAVFAQTGSSESRTPQAISAKKSRLSVEAKTGKHVGAKAKKAMGGTAKVAEPVAESVGPTPQTGEKRADRPSPGTTEKLDFDTDVEDAQKMEPGLELIQAAPRRARHRSLVPTTPSPEDSVVNRP
jgi:hypothetical protein